MSCNEEEIEFVSELNLNCIDQLELQAEIRLNALAAYHRLNSDGALSTDAQEWFCCAVYSELQQAKLKEMRKNEEEGNDESLTERTSQSWNMSLTKLLCAFKMNMPKFLKRMEHWNWLAQLGETYQNEIKDLQRRLSITMILHKHYKRIFEQIFAKPVATQEEGSYQSLYEFGWLIFLVIRNELPGFATTNLINGCQVLICSLELVYVNALEVPQWELINRSFSGLPKEWSSKDFDSAMLHKFSALDAIASLMPELPIKGVRMMQKAFFHKALLVMFMDQRLLGNDVVMRDLIKDGFMEVNLNALNRSYAQQVADISEIDERVILSYQPRTPSKSSEKSVNHCMLMEQELPQSMPREIKNALSQKEHNLLTNLENSLEEMEEKFSSKSQHCLDPEVAHKRFQLARGLYYKFIEQIISSELSLKPVKISQLLEQRKFNVTLIACCLELVLHVYEEQVEHLKFPFVLDCYDLDPYDFQKIPELVVRHHNKALGRQLVKHLHSVEEQCLGSLIFRESSQFWACFKLQVNLPSFTQTQTTEHSKENAEQMASGSLICLRKFYNLAQQRLNFLCQGLSLMDAFPLIWHLVEHSITLQRGELLLRGRHLDQLLMCAVHLHARMKKLRLNFSRIIQQYRRQPHAQSQVYRQVPLQDGRKVDIITFYNRVYVNSMASYARVLDDSCAKTTPQRLPLQEFTSTPNVKRMRSNIFVSPPALPRICLADAKCSNISIESTNPSTSKIESNSPPPINAHLKRFHSQSELTQKSRRPNILRRRTCFQ